MSLRIAFLFAFTIIYTNAASIQPVTERKCGMHKRGGLATNTTIDANKQAGLGEFPWTVGLYKDSYVTCAGSLIETNVVLTAGHCVKDVANGDLLVKVGLWDLNSSYEQHPVQERKISQIISHPEFSNENKSIKNDIALIVLEKSVELADHIGLVCLSKKDHQEKGKQCFAAGWGKEEKEGKSPTILKKLHLPVVSNVDCTKKLKEKMESLELTDKTICAGGEKASTCMGDGGAALVCETTPASENRYIQSGITSWGFGCSNDLPGVYTNIAQYRDWIDEHIKKLGLEVKHYEV